MSEKKNETNKWLMMLVLLLIVLVSITTMVYAEQLSSYLPSDEGALAIVNEINENEDSNDSQDSSDQDKEIHPGFVVYDDNGTWEMKTEIEIFKVAYENGEQVFTVISDDGEKVIAPGTSNSYTFKLKNTGDVAMDYDLEVKTSVSPSELRIPIQGKISRFDRKWIFGDNLNWDEMNGFDVIKDSFTLGSNHYSYYTLEWQWPFEGNDEWDTYLGNLAVDEEIVYTIEIHTIATASEDTDGDGGIPSTPSTGDNSQVLLYAIIGGIALILILLLIIKLRDEDEKDEK